MVKVTLIRGDGIGPEIADATLEVIAATGAKIEWDERAAGFGAIATHGAPLPQETVESIRANHYCLKGPLHTPVGGGYTSVNVALRQEFELYANVRPAKSFVGVKTPFDSQATLVQKLRELEPRIATPDGWQSMIDRHNAKVEATKVGQVSLMCVYA